MTAISHTDNNTITNVDPPNPDGEEMHRCTAHRCGCGKVRFTSVKRARCSFRSAGYRIRVYPCPDGRGYHVTRKNCP